MLPVFQGVISVTFPNDSDVTGIIIGRNEDKK